MSRSPEQNPLYLERNGHFFELARAVQVGTNGCGVILEQNPAILRHNDRQDLMLRPLIPAVNPNTGEEDYYVGDYETLFPGDAESVVVSEAEGVYVAPVGPEASFSLYLPLVPIAIATMGSRDIR